MSMIPGGFTATELQKYQAQYKGAAESASSKPTEVGGLEEVQSLIDQVVAQSIAVQEGGAGDDDFLLELGKTWSVLDSLLISDDRARSRKSASRVDLIAVDRPLKPKLKTPAQRQVFQEIADFKLRASPSSASRKFSFNEVVYCLQAFPKEGLPSVDDLVRPGGGEEVEARLAYSRHFSRDENRGDLLKFLMDKRGYVAKDIGLAFAELDRNKVAQEVPQVGAGLRNVGCTCYLNSALQFLRALPEMKHQVKLRALHSDNNLAQLLYKILDTQDRGAYVAQEEMHSFFAEASAQGWRTRDRALSQYAQEDAMEFARWIAEKVGVEPCTYDVTKERSVEGAISVSHDSGWDVESSRLLSSDISAQELFDKSMCDESVGMVRSFTSLPEIFTQSYMRFQPESLQKAPGRISSLESGIEVRAKDGGVALYRPKAVIVHRGEQRTGGHYVTYRLHGDDWYLYNDSEVSRQDNVATDDVEKGASAIVWERMK